MRDAEDPGRMGVRVEALGGAELRVAMRQAAAEELSPGMAAEVDRVWREMASQNPALYDGPTLRVDAFDAASGVISCSRSSFKHLATADRLGVAFRQLGIVGWLTGRDRGGREHVLLGRRSSAVRVYQGLWENAPSGGVPPRVIQASATSASVETLFEALRDEAEEELAMTLPAWGELAPARARARWWIVDDLARSLDIVVEIDMGEIDPRVAGETCASARRNAEYVDVAWVARDEWKAFASARCADGDGQVLSPPTVALARGLGWDLQRS